MIGAPVIVEVKENFLPHLSEYLEDFNIRTMLYPRFSMMSTFLSTSMMTRISEFDYVEKIYLDREIRIPEIPRGIALTDFASYKRIVELPRLRSLFQPPAREVDASWIGTCESRKYLEADIAEQHGITGKGIKIAVVDSDSGLRVDYHAQLRGRVISTTVKKGSPGSTCGHGSHVLTIAAGAKVDSKSIPVQGVAPDTTGYAVKSLLTPIGTGTTSDCIEALEKALKWNADIINMSLGSPPVPQEQDPLAEAISKIPEDKIVVVAAGNEGSLVSSPANAPTTVAVGSVNSRTNVMSGFSNRGPEIDFVAPGEYIYSGIAYETLLDRMGGGPVGYAILSGTSMAAPHISGAIALMMDLFRKDYSKKPTIDTVREIGRLYGEAKTDTRGYGPLKFTMMQKYADEVLS